MAEAQTQRTLAEVQAADGDSVACDIAVSNIRASALFLLRAIGPQAARRAIVATAAALEEDIKVANGNSELLGGELSDDSRRDSGSGHSRRGGLLAERVQR